MSYTKKFFYIFLVILFSIGLVFSGCKNKNNATITLNIMGYGESSNPEGQTFKRICTEFMEKYPEIKIDYELLYDTPYHNKVLSRLESKNYPHIAYMGADTRWGTPWKEFGQQIDNTPYFPSNVDENLIPDFYGTGIKPYVPLGGLNYCTVVALNRTLLEQIGGEIPQTYQDFVELANLCNKAGIKCLTTHGNDSWVWGSCLLSAILARTTDDPKWIEKAVNGKVKFTDPDFVTALESVNRLVRDGILDTNSLLTDSGMALSNFQNGKCLMYLDGQWSFGESNLGAITQDVKLIPIPPVYGEKNKMANCIASTWQVGYGITKEGASDPLILDAAKKWMDFFYSRDETILRLKDGVISAPIIKDFVPPEGMDPMVSEKASLSAYPSCYVIDSYLPTATNDVLNQGIKEIVAGQTTATKLAQKLQETFDLEKKDENKIN